MISKLILVEGIPGTGKSTTARFTADWLATQGLPAYLYTEGQPSHPADPDGMAFLDNVRYTELLNSSDQYRYNIQDHTAEQYGGYIVNYRRMEQQAEIPDGLYDALAAYDIYATATAEKYREISLGMWQSFADQASIEEGVYIFECCFLQNPFTMLIGKHNRDPEEVKAHIRALTAAIEPLAPLVIYLDPGSVRGVLQKAVDTRPQDWTDFVTEYITGQGYGKAHSLQGLEGVIQFYEQMKKLMEETLDELDIPLMRADVSQGDWETVHDEAAMFLRAETGYWPPEA